MLPLLAVMLVALLALFEREWRRGEIFSPADLVFQFYPWAHDAPRDAAANPTRSDEAFYHQPLMTSHFARLRQGEFPDYDDTRLSGVPAFFNGLDVGRAFSPFSLPYYLLPPEDAVNWYGPLRLLVAAFAMWLFLRDLGAGAGRRRRGRRCVRPQRAFPDVAQRPDADSRGVAAAGAAPGPSLRAAGRVARRRRPRARDRAPCSSAPISPRRSCASSAPASTRWPSYGSASSQVATPLRGVRRP